MTSPCPFCERVAAGAAEFGNTHALAFPDGFPVSPGHMLVIPRRHCRGLFDLDADEYDALWRLAREVRDSLHERLHPDGFNLGANDGAAAGQTSAACPRPCDPQVPRRRTRPARRTSLGDTRPCGLLGCG
jgi:diadenosine tetraphosphate (Ap4A) HIT family hydrolase